MNAFFKNLFQREDQRASEPEPVIDQGAADAIQKRIRLAAEGILENEALVADLDDDAAKVLLDWAIIQAQQIAAGTAGMDDVTAEEAMYQPLRALRRMLRGISQWVMAPDDAGLQKIIEQAGVIYGLGYVSPDPDRRVQFLGQIDRWSGDLPEMIRQLRNFVENQPNL